MKNWGKKIALNAATKVAKIFVRTQKIKTAFIALNWQINSSHVLDSFSFHAQTFVDAILKKKSFRAKTNSSFTHKIAQPTIFSGISLKPKSILGFFVLIAFQTEFVVAQPLNALPTNGKVVAGSATISQTSNTMTVNQSTQRAVINWDSFNVGKNATVNFNTPGSNAVTLNRVSGNSISVIDGAMHSNGQILLVNQNGVVFGKGAQVDAAAVTASTLNIADKDFMDGKSTYQGGGSGKIINKGTISTNTADGFIALLAPEVQNQGYVLARMGGSVAMAAGEQITLNFQGNHSLVGISVDKAAFKALVANKKVVETDGGLIVLAAGAANQLMSSVVKNTGKISANSAVNNGGVIELVANTVTQAGTVEANSTAQGKTGGQVNLVANDIKINKKSTTTATGTAGGGQVNVGLAQTQVSGGVQVNAQTPSSNTAEQNQAVVASNATQAVNAKQMANTVTVKAGAVIDVSATQKGNAGSIAIWSQVKTTVAGTLKAIGGALGGNGGFVETSSKGAVNLAPKMLVDTSAAKGRSGLWFLDPIDLIIDASAANVISLALANNNVSIAVHGNVCPSLGSCTQAGSGSLTIASGANILKQGTTPTTLTLTSSGIFNLNADISGQNLSVIISSSIAYLNVGTSITANQVTVQAQTIYSNGTINASNGATLGAAIQLLAQAIYVSGSLSTSTNSNTNNNTTNTSVTYNGNIIRKEDLPTFLTAQNNPNGNVASGLDVVYTSTAANDSSASAQANPNQTNIIHLNAVNDLTIYSSAQILANGTNGGQITLSAQQFNAQSGSLIQANGNNGPGGVIAVSGTDIHLAGTVAANGSNGGSFAVTANTLTMDNAAVVQTNGQAGPGGTITLTSNHDIQINQAQISANGSTDGGLIYVTSRSGSLNLFDSLIQTNGGNGRGGSIGISGVQSTNILSSNIAATGSTHGGSIYIGYDSTGNTSIPFTEYINIDANSVINTQASNGPGGFVETSGHYVTQLSGTITVGHGGNWLIDPYDYTYAANDTSIWTALNSGNVTINTLNASASGVSLNGNSTAGSGNIVINGDLRDYTQGAGNSLNLTAGGNITINGIVSMNSHNLSMIAGGNITVNSSLFDLTGYGLTMIATGNISIVNGLTIKAGGFNISAATYSGTGGLQNNYANTGFILAATSTTTFAGAISTGTNLVLNSATNQTFTLTGIISGSGGITARSGGTGGLVLTGANTYTGATILTSVVTQIYTASGASPTTETYTSLLAAGTTLASGQSITSGSYRLSMQGDGNLVLYTGSGFSTVAYATGTSGNNGAWLAMQGDGNLVIYGSNNTTVLYARYGVAGNNLTLGSSGSLALTNSSSGVLKVANTGSLGTSNSYAGNISIQYGTFSYESSVNQTLSGNISGTGALNKAGSSTLTLAGSNTYGGTTTINAGTLQAGSSSALPSSTDLTIATGATLDMWGYPVTVGSLSGAGSIISTKTPVQTGSGLIVSLDAANPASYSGSGTTWTNLVNNALNATISGNPTYSASGGYFTLNGTSQYFNLGQSASLLLNGSSAFTFNLWISVPTPASSNGVLISRQNTSVQGDYLMYMNNGSVVGYREVAPWGNAQTTSAVTANQLSQVTMVYNPTNTTIYTYINGAFQGSYSSPTSSTSTGTTTNTLIGAMYTNSVASNFFQGNIYAVQIYNTALSASQIQGNTAASLTVGNGSNTNFSGVISNAISLTKTGTSTLTLSGANTYSGTTTISAGTLQVGAGGATGNLGTGSIVNNAALIYNLSNAYTESNAISGSGTLTQNNASVLTLTGANTYTGSTTISAGTLKIGGSSTLGGGTYTAAIVNNGIFEYSSINSQTLSTGIISGTGSILKDVNTASTLTLAGANTYSGGTTVSAGTLRIASGGTAGATTGAMTITNATLDLQTAVTLGSLIMSGTSPAITNSSGTSSLVVSGTSTLANAITTSGAQTYSGAVTLGANTTLTTTNSAVVFAGAVDGTASGSQSLTVASGTGSIVLGGNVGGSVSLSSLNFSSSTASTVLIGSVTTAGSQTYAGALYVAGSSPTLSSSSGGVTITGAISTGAIFQFTYAATNYLLNGTSTAASSSAVQAGLIVTTSGTGLFSVSTVVPLSGIQYLVVGGGGGGSIGCTCYNGGGGGGGGAVLTNSNSSLATGTNYGITIGNAGAGATGSVVANGGNGGTTSMTGLVGGTVSAAGGGGSVGGVVTVNSNPWFGIGGTAGNANSGAGGYGGSNSCGSICSLENGGNGFTSSITGTSYVYGSGGGGGSGYSIGGGTAGSGGTGAGNGAPGNGNATSNGVSGTNYGSGGGGSYSTGNAGSGVGGTVVLALPSNALTINAGSGAVSIGSSSKLTSLTITSSSSSSAQSNSGVISGVTNLIYNGSGTFTLAGTNTYTGGTTISGGTLQVGTGSTTGNLGTGGVTDNAALIFKRSDAITDSNNISGSGTLTQAGSGTLTLSGNNSYTGGTVLNAGTLNLGSANAIGSTGTITFGNNSGSITGGGILQYSSSNTTDYSSRFSNAIFQTYIIDTNGQSVTLNSALSSNGGTLIKQGSGTLTLGGANTYANGSGTQIYGGTLQVSGDGNLGGDTPIWLIGGNLLASSSFTTSKNIIASGTGGNIQVASGATLTLSGSMINGTTINLGGSSTSSTYTGSIVYAPSSGTVTNLNLYAGTLLANSSFTLANALTVYGGTISATSGSTLTLSNIVSGTAGINIGDATNTGTVILSNTSNAFSGGTTVNYGTLSVSAQTNLPSGNTVTLTNGATLLDTANSVTLANNIVLGAGGGVIAVNGPANTLILSGTMTGANAIQFGTSANNGIVSLSTIKAFTGNMSVVGATVKLAYTTGGVLSGVTAIGISGSGTLAITGGGYNPFSKAVTITIANGTFANQQTGTGGIGASFSAGSTINLNGNATVSLSGVGDTWGSLTLYTTTFNSTGTGNSITGGAIAAQGATTVNVTNSGESLTISSILENANSVAASWTKTGAGTLILTGANTYSGGTTISVGTIQVGAGSTTGNLGTGGVVNNSALVYNRSDSLTDNNLISGTGTVTQAGTGTTTLGGANTYTGNTTINAGTLANTVSGSSTRTATFIINNGGTYKLLSTNGFPNNSTNGYTFVVNSGGTLDLNGVGWIDGGSTGYAIQLNGGSLSNSSATAATVTMSYSPTRDIVLAANSYIGGTGNITLNGVISGAYSLTNSNTGVVTLGGANSYSGGTFINAGTVQISSDGNLGAVPSSAATNVTINGGGLLASGQTSALSIGANRGIAIGSSGGSISNASTTYTLTVAGVISGSNTLTINAGSNTGTVILSNAANSYTGNTTINGGTLQIGSAGTLGSGSYAGNISIATGATFKYSSSAAQTLSGAISGVGTLTKDTSTSVLTISNVNTLFTGPVNANAGTLALTNPSALGGSTGGLLTIGAAGTVDLQYAGTVTLATLSIASGGAITNSTNNSALTVSGTSSLGGSVSTNGLQTYTGAVTLGANTSLTATAAPVTFSSTIDSVTGSNYSLTITNGSGSNTFAGVVGGTTPLSTISVSGASTLMGSVTTNGASGQLWSSDLIIAGNISLNSNNGSVTVNGAITIPQGLNILQLTGSGAYSDTVGGSTYTGTVSSSATALPGGGGNLSYSAGAYSWVAPVNVQAQYLVVAGGGGGGGNIGGGGGGGGVVAGTFTGGTALTYTAIVGAGGSGINVNQIGGGAGGDSKLTQATLSLNVDAVGGGGGAYYSNNGLSGGSGGGAGGGGAGSGGSGTSGQGNAGGAAPSSLAAAGGGGGAGGPGSAGNNSYTLGAVAGGNGGPGLASNITGSTVYYGAGGGGSSGAYGGSGGLGGGGNGGTYIIAGANSAAVAGSGYGSGGGGGYGTILNGANGSAGTVILSYYASYTFAINAGSGKVSITNNVNPTTANANYLKSISIASTNTTSIISGNINGTSSLTFNGTSAGVLQLSGSNTYTGGTTVSGGILAISADANLGAVPSIATPASVTLSGGALQAIGATGETSPTVVTLNVNRGITLSSASGLAASTTTTSGTTYVDVLSIPGVVTGAGALTINGASQGGTVLLTNSANTYGTTSLTTATTIKAGILAIVADGSLGTLPSAAQAASISLTGGTLQAYGPSNESSATTVTLNALRGITVSANTAGLAATSNTNYTDILVVSGVVTGTNTLLINSAGQGGKVSLTGANTHTGNLTISAGTLQVGGSGTLNSGSYGTGSISIATGAVLQYSSSADQNLYGGITGGGSILKDTSTSLLSLSTQSANSNYSGGTTIKKGVVDLYSAYSAGTGTITLGDTVSGSNAVNLNVLNTTTLTNGIILNPYGVLTVSNRFSSNGAGYYPIYTGGITGNNNLIIGGVSGGSMTFTTNPINISGTITNTTAAWGATPVSITAAIGSNVTGIIQNGGAPLAISGALNINSGGTTITDTSGTVTISGGVTGTGNLVLNNNTTTNNALTISTASVNNVGTITNSGTGTGATLISGGVGSNVTRIIQNSATSALSIATTALTVNSSGTTLTDTAGSLTVSGGVTGTGNLVLNNNSNTANGITLSTTNVNNTGTITNSGNGTGNSLISIAIGTANTGVVQNSSTSALILTGTNLYTNGTTITSGTLQVGAGGTAGTLGSGTLSNSGNLSFNLSSALSIGSNLTGAGSVTQLGSGALTLSGDNSYQGGTFIGPSSKIIVTSANALGGSSGGVVNIGASGILDLQYAGTITLTSLVMATGSSITNTTTNSALTVSGTSTLLGTVTTSGAQTYTGAVLVGGATTLNTTNAGVSFGSTVSSSVTLTEVIQFLGGGSYNFAGTAGTATGTATTFADGSSIAYNSSTGVYTFVAGSSASSQYLVVGGGGGGSRGVNSVYYGAGAGGGAVLSGATSLVLGSSYSVTVGVGGAGQSLGTAATISAAAGSAPATTSASSGYNGGKGGASSFASITANGGLGSIANSAIGSASGNGYAGGTGSGAPYAYVQGSVCSAGGCGAGGGGGAGGVGTATAAGAGISSSITGTAVTYGTGGWSCASSACTVANIVANTGAGAGDNGSPSPSGSAGVVILSIPNAITTTSLTINAGNGAVSMVGNVTNLNLVINSKSASSSIAGVISGPVSLTYNNGSGYTTIATPVLVLSNTNTYSGGTTVIAGTAQAGSATAFGTGAITVGSGVNSLGSVDVHGYAIANSLTVYGGGALGAIANNGSTAVTLGNAITVGSAFSFGGSGGLTISNAISASTNGIAFVGTGSYTLTNTSNSIATIGGVSATTIGALNLVDSVALTVGSVTLNSIAYAGINSSGAVTLTATSSSGTGISFSNNLNATGAIIISGTGSSSSSYNGIYIASAVGVTSTGSTVTMTGVGGYGVQLYDGSSSVRANGDLNINGTGANSTNGIGVFLTYASGTGGFIKSDTGNINLKGVSNSPNYGTYVRMPVIATLGSVTISGAGSTGGLAFDGWYGSVAAGQNITLIGYSTAGYGVYLHMANNASGYLLAANSANSSLINGNITIAANAAASSGIYTDIANTIYAYNGSIDFRNSAFTGTLANGVTNSVFATAGAAGSAVSSLNGIAWNGSMYALNNSTPASATNGGTITINSNPTNTATSAAATGFQLNGNGSIMSAWGDITINANGTPNGVNSAGAWQGIMMNGTSQQIRSYNGAITLVGTANNTTTSPYISGGVTLYDDSDLIRAKNSVSITGIDLPTIGAYLTITNTGTNGGVTSETSNIIINGISNSASYAGTYIRNAISAPNGAITISGAGNIAGLYLDWASPSVSAGGNISLAGYSTAGNGLYITVGGLTPAISSTGGNIILAGYSGASASYGIYDSGINIRTTGGNIVAEGASLSGIAGTNTNATSALVAAATAGTPVFATGNSAIAAYGVTGGFYDTGTLSASGTITINGTSSTGTAVTATGAISGSALTVTANATTASTIASLGAITINAGGSDISVTANNSTAGSSTGITQTGAITDNANGGNITFASNNNITQSGTITLASNTTATSTVLYDNTTGNKSSAITVGILNNSNSTKPVNYSMLAAGGSIDPAVSVSGAIVLDNTYGCTGVSCTPISGFITPINAPTYATSSVGVTTTGALTAGTSVTIKGISSGGNGVVLGGVVTANSGDVTITGATTAAGSIAVNIPAGSSIYAPAGNININAYNSNPAVTSVMLQIAGSSAASPLLISASGNINLTAYAASSSTSLISTSYAVLASGGDTTISASGSGASGTAVYLGNTAINAGGNFTVQGAYLPSLGTVLSAASGVLATTPATSSGVMASNLSDVTISSASLTGAYIPGTAATTFIVPVAGVNNQWILAYQDGTYVKMVELTLSLSSNTVMMTPAAAGFVTNTAFAGYSGNTISTVNQAWNARTAQTLVGATSANGYGASNVVLSVNQPASAPVGLAGSAVAAGGHGITISTASMTVPAGQVNAGTYSGVVAGGNVWMGAATTGAYYGITLQAPVTSNNGSITLIGTSGGNGGVGVYIAAAGSLTTLGPNNGSINVYGSSTNATGGYGVYLLGSSVSSPTVISSAAATNIIGYAAGTTSAFAIWANSSYSVIRAGSDLLVSGSTPNGAGSQGILLTYVALQAVGNITVQGATLGTLSAQNGGVSGTTIANVATTVQGAAVNGGTQYAVWINDTVTITSGGLSYIGILAGGNVWIAGSTGTSSGGYHGIYELSPITAINGSVTLIGTTGGYTAHGVELGASASITSGTAGGLVYSANTSASALTAPAMISNAGFGTLIGQVGGTTLPTLSAATIAGGSVNAAGTNTAGGRAATAIATYATGLNTADYIIGVVDVPLSGTTYTKMVELRLTLVGNLVYAAAINAQYNTGTLTTGGATNLLGGTTNLLTLWNSGAASSTANTRTAAGYGLGNLTFTNSVSVSSTTTSTNGAISLYGSSSHTTGGVGIQINGSSSASPNYFVTTGPITFAGYAAGTSAQAIYITTYSYEQAGGNITFAGSTPNSSNSQTMWLVNNVVNAGGTYFIEGATTTTLSAQNGGSSGTTISGVASPVLGSAVNGGNQHAVYLNGAGSVTYNGISYSDITAAGNIWIAGSTGSGVNGFNGLYINGPSINSTGGSITLIGASASATGTGAYFAATSNVIASGDINIYASNSNGSYGYALTISGGGATNTPFVIKAGGNLNIAAYQAGTGTAAAYYDMYISNYALLKSGGNMIIGLASPNNSSVYTYEAYLVNTAIYAGGSLTIQNASLTTLSAQNGGVSGTTISNVATATAGNANFGGNWGLFFSANVTVTNGGTNYTGIKAVGDILMGASSTGANTTAFRTYAPITSTTGAITINGTATGASATAIHIYEVALTSAGLTTLAATSSGSNTNVGVLTSSGSTIASAGGVLITGTGTTGGTNAAVTVSGAITNTGTTGTGVTIKSTGNTTVGNVTNSGANGIRIAGGANIAAGTTSGGTISSVGTLTNTAGGIGFSVGAPSSNPGISGTLEYILGITSANADASKNVSYGIVGGTFTNATNYFSGTNFIDYRQTLNYTITATVSGNYSAAYGTAYNSTSATSWLQAHTSVAISGSSTFGVSAGSALTVLTFNSTIGASSLNANNVQTSTPLTSSSLTATDGAIVVLSGTPTYTITKANLTITDNAQSYTYNGLSYVANQQFTLSGLVTSIGGVATTDAVSSVTQAFKTGTTVGSGTVLTGSNAAIVGAYNAVPSAAVGTNLGNYNISYAGAASTVTAAPLGITITGTYAKSTTITPTAFTTNGLVNSETITAISSATVNNA
ncbi:autotransporter-associated beta strand repeat-containing protein, partial [Polynucleobacter sp. UK-Kesae-W10]|uniref:autotransporter-associated beta strand repeat-containing protein n=1 Tax=Polynucleobacter sp. UK-Kesae-W10 TaxID=1819738 RepID=UPI001C0E7DBB